MQLLHANLILPDAIKHGTVMIENGRIKQVKVSAAKSRSGSGLELSGGFLAPGFVDLHIHGGVGRDTMEASESAFREITEFHLRGGTTSLTLTTLTTSEENILNVLNLARRWHNQSLGGSRIVGVHVEGPFISRKKAGAQDPAHIRDPQPVEWKKYLRFGSLITEMTVAPELPGAINLIKALRKNGTIASGGHTDAGEPVLLKAAAAGLNHATHTFNAMSSVQKNGPYRIAGMLEFAMTNDSIMCELIADAVHVPPTLMNLLFRAKGRDGICLITDATAGAGLAPGTTFSLVSIQARVTDETAVLEDGSGLAGSTLTMIEGVRRCVEKAKFPLVDAVRMASTNPARQLGRADEFGSIEKGRKADLVWFDEEFQVKAVWLDGDLRFMA